MSIYNSYRSLQTVEAVQYFGEEIPGVTCDGNLDKHGCDSTRRHLPHVHTAATGGVTCLKPGDFIMPVAGGPFLVIADAQFRTQYGVTEPGYVYPTPPIATLPATPEPKSKSRPAKPEA